MQRYEHHLLLSWLILAGLAGFGLLVLWQQGFLELLYRADQSKLCVVIALLFVFASARCLGRINYVSTQLSLAERATGLLASSDRQILLVGEEIHAKTGGKLPTGFLTEYLEDLIRARANSGTDLDVSSHAPRVNATLAETFASRLKGPHEFGWFLSDVILRLGLLGTIVGFILMLSSVADANTIDVSSMQQILRKMSSGMGTALYTTLTGVLGSILLTLQHQMLDRASDQLLELTIHVGEVTVLPRLP